MFSMCMTIDDIDSKQPFLHYFFWLFTLPSEKRVKELVKSNATSRTVSKSKMIDGNIVWPTVFSSPEHGVLSELL